MGCQKEVSVKTEGLSLVSGNPTKSGDPNLGLNLRPGGTRFESRTMSIFSQTIEKITRTLFWPDFFVLPALPACL